MFRVVPDVELVLDQPGNPCRRPELVVPPVGLGPLEQQLGQSLEVVVRQAWGRTRVDLGRHAAGRACGPDPAGHGLDVNPQDRRDRLAGRTVRNSLYRLLTAAFQFDRRSDGSAHTS